MHKHDALIYKLQSQTTLLITLLTSLIIAIVGSALLFVASIDSLWSANNVWRALPRDLGSLLVVSVALALVWELSAKRSFVDELYSKFNIAQSIQSSNLRDIVFHAEYIDWEALFNTAQEVDLFFAYNTQWRMNNEVRLQQLAKRKSARIRLILPDPNNSTTVADMARRFNRPTNRLKLEIKEAQEQFEELARTAGTDGAKIEIYFYGLSLHYSLYRFDNTYIFALYSQQPVKTNVPHFICSAGGTLAKFFNLEIENLVSEQCSSRAL